MLQAIGGLVTLGLLGTSLVIGVRLVRLGRAHGSGPELWLGLYFLLYGCLASVASIATYVGWSSADAALPDAVARALNGAFFALSTVGMTCLALFTQRTFRPASPAARLAVFSIGAALLVAGLAVGVTEGFEVRVLNGPAYWVHYLARLSPLAWVSVESLSYGSKLRRRGALGLADPLVTNRFLLWGVWGGVTLVLALADPLARLWYWWLTGTTTSWIADVGRPIIEVVVPITSALGLGALATLVLTFFPTAAYRRWIERRQPA